jgi:hypothetical protein
MMWDTEGCSQMLKMRRLQISMLYYKVAQVFKDLLLSPWQIDLLMSLHHLQPTALKALAVAALL